MPAGMGGAAPAGPQTLSQPPTIPLSPPLSPQDSQPLRLVVCGTDTDVGKTVVSALLVQGLGASYWKPVQCGLEGGGDRERLRQWLQLSEARLLPEAYRLAAPVSPHWAAELEGAQAGAGGLSIDASRLALPAVEGPLVVECAGGLLVPLRRDRLQIEQLQAWGLPVLLVARSGLGTLNHTLLSLEALAHRRIPVLGLVVNGPPHADNPRTLAALGGVPLLACLPPLETINRPSLAALWQSSGLGPNLAAAAQDLAAQAGPSRGTGEAPSPGGKPGSGPGPGSAFGPAAGPGSGPRSGPEARSGTGSGTGPVLPPLEHR